MSSILKKIAIIGSGNWGSVIAKIVGYNVQALDGYELRVPMYVYEEQLENGKLTDLINQTHENVKYLPGVKLPENIVALPSVLDCAKDADILVFVVPHQFVKGICKQLRGQIKSDAIAISLIKGFEECDKGLDVKDTGLNLISNVIHESLDIDCAVLMGANIASEVANENYCEATIGCSDKIKGKMLKKLFQTSYFRIVVVDDVQTVEMCGALKTILYIAALIAEGLDIIANTKAAIVRLGFLEIVEFTRYHFKPCESTLSKRSKANARSSLTYLPIFQNIVALGAGFIDGLKYGDNTKAAVIRLGLMEMVKFAEDNFKNSKIETFLESCGVADLVTTCYSGRNKKIAEAFVHSGKTIEELEKEMLNGQKLQGPPTAAEVYEVLHKNNMEEKYPLFTAIHYICIGKMKPEKFIDCLKNHPAHM